MSSAFMRSTIEVRHASFSFWAATALSRIAATSTLCAGADAGAAAEFVLVAALPLAGVALPAGAASALVPRIALMILPKILIVCSQ